METGEKLIKKSDNLFYVISLSNMEFCIRADGLLR